MQGQAYTISAPGELVQDVTWTGTGQAVLEKLHMFVSCDGLPAGTLTWFCNSLGAPEGLQKRNFDGLVALPALLFAWLLCAYLILLCFVRERR